MELIYHVPLSFWAIGALIRGDFSSLSHFSVELNTDFAYRSDDPKVPVHLLVYAVQTAITTATCIADYLSWSDFQNVQKIELGKLYVPYLALCKLLLAF